MSNVSDNESSAGFIASEPHRLIGIVYMTLGVVLLIPLIISLLAMAQKEQLKHSCYKIMLVMTVLDIINLCTSAIVSGYYSYIGIQFCCGNEEQMIIVGRFTLGIFFMYSGICLLLGFNRFVDLYSDGLANRLFGHHRTWFWLIPPLLYGAAFFTPWITTIIYNSDLDIWIFTSDELGRRGVILHEINNIGTPIGLFILYSMICVLLRTRYKPQSNDAAGSHISDMKFQVILISFFICSITFVDCLAYVIVQNTSDFPPALYKIVQIMWQLLHGSSGCIYLIFNKTIRSKVRNFFFPKKNQVHIVAVQTIVSPQQCRHH